MRRAINLFAVLSLLLCVATAALWARSLWRVDQVQLKTEPTPLSTSAWKGEMVEEQTFILQSNAGGLMGAWYVEEKPRSSVRRGKQGLTYHSDDGVRYPVRRPDDPTVERRVGLLGFEYATIFWIYKRSPDTHRSYYLTVPMWAVCLVLALPPVIVFPRRWRERRRRGGNLCLTCGYDLRATTGRCPECGTEVGHEG